MNNYLKFIPKNLLKKISKQELEYLIKVFDRHNGIPDLNSLWNLMDEEWIKYGCNPNKFNDKINKFYQHPVWLLNGLFSESDSMSVKFRKTLFF